MVTLYEKKSVPLNSNAIKSIVVNDMPQQTNGSNCGIYTIAYMDLIYDNIPFTSLNPTHISTWRQCILCHMVSDVLTY